MELDIWPTDISYVRHYACIHSVVLRLAELELRRTLTFYTTLATAVCAYHKDDVEILSIRCIAIESTIASVGRMKHATKLALILLRRRQKMRRSV